MSSHKLLNPFSAILLILGVGLIIRLAMLPLMLYDFDEGIAGIYALQFIVKGQLPMHGIRTSLGFHNPPFFIWLISLPTAISRNPAVSVALFHVLNIVAVGALSWQLLRARYNVVAISVAILGALAPGPLLLENRMWGHALIPVFSTAIVTALWRLNHRPGSRLASVSIPILIVAAQQSHFSGALFLISVAVISILCRLRFSLSWLIAGVAAAVSLYLPWLLHDSSTGWTNLRTIIDIITSGSTSTPSRASFGQAILYSLTDFGSITAFSPDGYNRWLKLLPWVTPYRLIGVILFVSGSMAALRRLTVGKDQVSSFDRNLAMTTLIWTIVPAVTFGFLKVQPVPAYWLAALPGPWLLAGLAVQWSLRPRPIFAPALALLIILASLAYLLGYAAVMYKGDTRYQAYPTFRDQAAAMFFISEITRDQPYHLRQELRSWESGIDYNLLYLLTWAEGNGLRLRPADPPSPDSLEVIYHNSALPWLPREHELRASYLFQRFGLVHVLMQQKNQ